MAEDQRVLFSTQHEMQIKYKVPLQQSTVECASVAGIATRHVMM